MARFYGIFWLLLLAGCAGYAALVLYSATWPEVAALREFYHWRPRRYTEAEFHALRTALAGVALGLGGLALAASVGPAGRRAWAALGGELAAVGRGLRASWRRLPRRQRGLALGTGLALTALRAYYSVCTEPYDDAISFEVFVRARLLAVSACYPMPNNHVLSNTLSWLFYQVHPGFWWSMRLPVLLLSTAGTVLGLLGLLRWSNFRVALLAVLGFGVLQLSLYHATSGRGYWPLVTLAAVAFPAVLVLAGTLPASNPAPGAAYRRAGALALALAGVLGLYTVPTFAYFLASAYGWLLLGALRRRQYRQLGVVVGSGALTLLGAGLLYAPLLLVSGPALLLHNEYVAALAPGEFWRQLPGYLWQSEGFLAGQRLVGAVGALLVLALYCHQWQRARAGKLCAGSARLGGGLRQVALWFALLPYAVMLVQRVQAPERTLLYKAQFGFVLAALGVDYLLRQTAGRPRYRWLRPALLGGAGLYAVIQVSQLERYNALRRMAWGPAHAGFRWLAAQPPGAVLAPNPGHRVLLRFYAHSERVGQRWRIDDVPVPGVRYRYLVGEPGQHQVPGAPPLPARPVFRNATLEVYVTP